MNDQPASVQPPKSALHITLDWRFIVVVLLAVIGVMLYLWKPWQASVAAKTITVRGEAEISAVPDVYKFQPYFQDADAKKVTTLGNEAVAAIKKLGVADADIKTSVQSAAGKPEPIPVPLQDNGTSSSIAPDYRRSDLSSYYLTITLKDKALAQKVADYLATTTATGQVTPQNSFSKAARSKLDIQARKAASSDAKQKAEATAGELGAKVGKVVRISEDGGYGIYARGEDVAATTTDQAKVAGPTIQPGTDEVTYSFSVIFELK